MEKVDIVVRKKWVETGSILVELQGYGLFTNCPVTRFINTGRAVISLNDHLNISIYRLHAMTANDCKNVFRMLGSLPPDIMSKNLPSDLVKLCVRRHRLRLECHRRESVDQMKHYLQKYPSLLALVEELRSYEKDRLYTLLRNMELYKANLYMDKMMVFVTTIKPTNFGEMVAYIEFVMTYVEDEVLLLKQRIRNEELRLPDGNKLSVWTRERAMETVFQSTVPLRKKFDEVLDIVLDNGMFGNLTVERGLTDGTLLATLHNKWITFGSAASAVYHVVKHPTDPLADHMLRVHVTLINRGADVNVELGQDGDVRIITLEDGNGKCIVLERDGSLILCSFLPKPIQRDLPARRLFPQSQRSNNFRSPAPRLIISHRKTACIML